MQLTLNFGSSTVCLVARKYISEPSTMASIMLEPSRYSGSGIDIAFYSRYSLHFGLEAMKKGKHLCRGDVFMQASTVETGGGLSQKFGADLSQLRDQNKFSGDADVPAKLSLADRRAKVDNVSPARFEVSSPWSYSASPSSHRFHCGGSLNWCCLNTDWPVDYAHGHN